MTFFLVITFFIAFIAVFFSFFLNKLSFSEEKFSPYECGFLPLDNLIQNKFYLKFFLIAILFLIFDLEAVLLYPLSFCAAISHLSFSFFVFFLFIFILILGLLYELLNSFID